jgi:Bacterial protein of unknown function (DUF839)
MAKRGKLKAGAAIAGATLLLGATAAGAAAPGTSKGPNTSVDPYVIPVDARNTTIKSLLTVDDNTSPNGVTGYPMAGIPDGLGAYQDGANVSVLMSHEFGATTGVARSHGAAGAFVSKWTVNPATGAVTAGSDLMTSVDYDGTTTAVDAAPSPAAAAFARFCSSDLAGPASLYNSGSGNGFNGQLFFHGEETGLAGRVVATDPATGNAWVLPSMGFTSWESAVAASTPTSDTTLVIGLNDSSAASQSANLIYVGTKNSTGATPVQKAGLTNGTINAIKLTSGITTDAAFRAANAVGVSAPFTMVTITGATGVALQASAASQGAFFPDRTEDGSWDPSNPNDFYYLTTGTTASATGRGGLWRMRFTDRNTPSLGGTLTLVASHAGNHLANSASFYMPDNLTIDNAGHILIQEDPGGDAYIARIFAFDIATNQMKAIATFDPAQFTPATPGFLTNDEESSGIIPAPASIGPNTFLFDAQVHTNAGLSNAARDAEKGQLLTMTVDFTKVFAAAPEPVVPEVPFPALLLVGGMATIGGFFFLRRRSVAAV